MRGRRPALLISAAASVSGAIVALISTPLLVAALGIEAYGLLGVFATLQVICSVLDFGIGATLARELARSTAQEIQTNSNARLARTLEISILSLAVSVGIAVWIAAPVIVEYWINPQQLHAQEAVQSLRFGAMFLALQFPLMFYTAGLMGMQRATIVGLISIPVGLLRTFGAIVALWIISPTLSTYFITQTILILLHTLLLRRLFWSSVPPRAGEARFDRGILRSHFHFSIKANAVSITGTILIQADKIIASKLLPLDQFGYYMLASALASGIGLIVGPFSGVMSPWLTQLAVVETNPRLLEVYHTATQMLCAVSIPMAMLLGVYAHDILLAWTGDILTADRSSPILVLLSCANGVGGALGLLYYFELAQGRTLPALASHVVSIGLLVPVTSILVLKYGAVGAGGGWLLHNVGMLLFRPPITHRGLPRKEKIAWYLEDLGPAILATLLAALAMKMLLPMPQSRLGTVVALGAILCCLTLVASMASWRIRLQALTMLRSSKIWM